MNEKKKPNKKRQKTKDGGDLRSGWVNWTGAVTDRERTDYIWAFITSLPQQTFCGLTYACDTVLVAWGKAVNKSTSPCDGAASEE